ncbi:hypothetical protein AVEN_55977-1 [Araneus ventricosus]|uniref:Uncharacterized protein n=1 Tax=Araneus ventricosus TaxID=182803 RepID=A0A4Y2GSH3_ARAVE|nr:hypothetical protein AVEN_55977-1 [Araneus ventricosus]
MNLSKVSASGLEGFIFGTRFPQGSVIYVRLIHIKGSILVPPVGLGVGLGSIVNVRLPNRWYQNRPLNLTSMVELLSLVWLHTTHLSLLGLRYKKARGRLYGLDIDGEDGADAHIVFVV